MLSLLPHFSCALQIGMKILWCEGVVLPFGGVGKWVVSGNERVNRGRGICLHVCMSGVFNRVNAVLNLSVQSSKLKFILI